MMKKTIGLIGVVVMCAGVAFGGMISEDPGELAIVGQGSLDAGLGDYELFSTTYGAQISYREWFRFPWAVGLNLGVAQWDMDHKAHALKYDKLTDYRGDVLTVPIGAALYFNLMNWDNWNVILEAGLQYVFVDSNMSVFNNEEGANRRESVSIDNAVVWNVGAEYNYMLTENMFVLAGLGYQNDVMAAKTKHAGLSMHKTSFENIYLRLGVQFLF